eukprot:385812_1
MSTKLTFLKRINNNITLTAFGYVRQMQLALKLCDIPMRVSYLCLAFYHHGEYFATTDKDTELSVDKMTISNKSRTNTIARCKGYQIIESEAEMIAKWTVKINNIGVKKSGTDGNITIGLVNGTVAQLPPEKHFSFSNTGNRSLLYQPFEAFAGDICKFVSGDELTIILNAPKRTIKVQKNNESKLRCLFKNIHKASDICYKLCVILRGQNDSVKLVDFKVEYI